MKHLVTFLLCAGVVVGCATRRMPPLARQADGGLNTVTEDVDAGFVRMRSGFSPTTYTAIILTPFKVSTAEMKDEKDVRLAQNMTGLLQTQLVNRLQLAGIFAKVIDATASAEVPGGEKALRLEGEITNLSQGSRVMRSGVGFGVGAASAQIETRLLDVQSQNIQ